eukprot:CAMPEP_0175756702 /NCGR_PEP_ID=MMETSP0097-20121207/64080_1 /TAXON_ID=311494 /ORGANISM="Alexandrium monilatum, Strain CCMP3105" /LENGTH=321 /DNA_ID=CAMNT_0017065853 /DNA_START=1 /DNA_END=963 /DNA_ORIENTATION=-
MALARIELSPGCATSDAKAGAGSSSSAAGSGSASSGPAGSGGRSFGMIKSGSTNLLGALEESTSRILSQTLRPIKGLVNDVQDFNREWRHKAREGDGSDGQAFDPSLGVHVLFFSELREVRLRDNGKTVELTLTGGLPPSVLPLQGAPIDQAVIHGLVAGLRSAVLHADSQANWAELRKALREEQRARTELPGGPAEALPAAPSEAGYRTLEVYEVERWRMATFNWQTPFLPSDRELSWRWVDATGKRHPHLRRQLSPEEAAHHREPPCEMDALFQAQGDWSIERGPGADAEGWKYGLAWRSSTWDAAPGIFDVLRRRKWL